MSPHRTFTIREHPSTFIDETFQKYLKEGCLDAFNDAILKAVDDEREQIQELLLIEELPSDTCLVRVRCMIQDMKDPDIYLDRFEYSIDDSKSKEEDGEHHLLGSAKWRVCPNLCRNDVDDSMKIVFDSNKNVNKTRHSFTCVSIPNLSYWCHSSKVGKINDSKEGGKKKQPTNDLKKIHVYIFDEEIGEKIILNDCYEFIGVYEPKYSALSAICIDKLSTLNPHVSLSSFKMSLEDVKDSRHKLCVHLSNFFGQDTLLVEYFICHLVSKLYSRIETETSMLLGNFSLNIFNIAVSQTKGDADITDKTEKKGKDIPNGIFKLMESILPLTMFFPLSASNLNRPVTHFVPHKVYGSEDNDIEDHLETGVLQIAPHTNLIIDETALKDGDKLDTDGVKNIRILADFIRLQKVDYDFKFHTLPFNVNAPTLILSEGRSMLPVNFLLKYQPDESNSTSHDDLQMINESELQKIRNYLTFVKHHLHKDGKEFEIGDEMQSIVESSLITSTHEVNKDENKENDENGGKGERRCGMSVEAMHAHLTLARFMAISLGSSQLTSDVWQKVIELERLREERLVGLKTNRKGQFMNNIISHL